MAVNLYLDVSDALEGVEYMKQMLGTEAANNALRHTVYDTAKKVKTIVGDEVPQDYDVSSSWVKKQVGSPVWQGGGSEVSIRIPIKGARGSIGGTFGASGGKRGWAAARGGRYKVKARIVKGTQSVLPSTMDHQSAGMPPFRNIGSKLGKATFVRKGKARFPIVSVKGLSVAQMPMNRSREDIENEIQDYMAKRLAHYFQLGWGK